LGLTGKMIRRAPERKGAKIEKSSHHRNSTGQKKKGRVRLSIGQTRTGEASVRQNRERSGLHNTTKGSGPHARIDSEDLVLLEKMGGGMDCDCGVE